MVRFKKRSISGKKLLTPQRSAESIGLHTATNSKKMRTKNLLLSAAALVAGVLSAQAQSNVYSVNVVGYVNTVFQPAGKYTLVANPLDNAGSNNIVGLVDVLPNQSQILAWNVSAQQFVTATKSALLGGWNTNLALLPGQGFFVKTPASLVNPITNTFVGQVVVGYNQTNTVALPQGYILVGSPIPFAGALNDSGTNTLNLGSVLPNQSQVLKWNLSAQQYITGTKSALLGGWNTNLSFSVGEGFFIKSASAVNWSQTLQ